MNQKRDKGSTKNNLNWSIKTSMRFIRVEMLQEMLEFLGKWLKKVIKLILKKNNPIDMVLVMQLNITKMLNKKYKTITKDIRPSMVVVLSCLVS